MELPGGWVAEPPTAGGSAGYRGRRPWRGSKGAEPPCLKSRKSPFSVFDDVTSTITANFYCEVGDKVRVWLECYLG